MKATLREIKRRGLVGLATLGLILTAAHASAFSVTAGLTGFWEQPDQQNHGLIISVSQLPDGRLTGVAFWAHYTPDGRPTWLVAQGGMQGASMQADLFEVQGIRFLQASGTQANPERRVGSLSINFQDCDRGLVGFTTDLPGIGSGSFRIQRLTTLPGVDCSGGISDNVAPSARPEFIAVDLQAGAGFPAARGEVELELRPNGAEFEVEIRNVPVGQYELLVGGVVRGSFSASRRGGGAWADGRIEFRSPQRRDRPLLDFDPRGQALEVRLDGQTVLSGRLPESGDPLDRNGAPEFGDSEIKIRMQNTGVFPRGSAELLLEQEPNKVSFEIDLDDVPVGSYTLLVDTVEVGTITVDVARDGDTEGELEFRFPASPGYPLLDFDPRGALIEIVQNGTALFFAEFPGQGESVAPGRPGTNDELVGPELEIVFELLNLGVYPRASAEADLYRDEDGLEFDVEIDDLPPGLYTLRVGGVVRGRIEAVADRPGSMLAEGKIEFSNPVQPGEKLLNFAVSGQLIEILEGDRVLFRGVFPAF